MASSGVGGGGASADAPLPDGSHETAAECGAVVLRTATWKTASEGRGRRGGVRARHTRGGEAVHVAQGPTVPVGELGAAREKRITGGPGRA